MLSFLIFRWSESSKNSQHSHSYSLQKQISNNYDYKRFFTITIIKFRICIYNRHKNTSALRQYLMISTLLIISMLLLKRSASTPRRLHNISVLTVFLDSLLLNLSLVRFFGSAFIPCLEIDGTVGISLIDLLSWQFKILGIGHAEDSWYVHISGHGSICGMN